MAIHIHQRLLLLFLPLLIHQATSVSELEKKSSSFCTSHKYIMQSYFERYHHLVDSDFEDFILERPPLGSCREVDDASQSIVERHLIGEGSHRHLSTRIRFDVQQEPVPPSCELVIVERLPSGVFADPFELQHLKERRVFKDVAVLGDTNLELPSFLSNRSAVEIHMDVDDGIVLGNENRPEINIKLPLHARYQISIKLVRNFSRTGTDFSEIGKSRDPHRTFGSQETPTECLEVMNYMYRNLIGEGRFEPLEDSGYSRVNFGNPDLFLCCFGVERRCRVLSISSHGNGGGVVWNIPAGMRAHAGVVSVVTFSTAILSALLIVVSSLYHSNIAT